MKNLVAEQRYNYEVAGIIWQGKPFDTGREMRGILTSVGLLALIAITMQTDFSIEWKCTDNTFIPLNAMGIIGLIQVIAMYVQSCYGYEQYLDGLIDACTTNEQVVAIDIVSNWPLNQ